MIYPCLACMEADPNKFEICTVKFDNPCPKFLEWDNERINGILTEKMCPNYKTCFLSVYVGNFTPSSVDCAGTFAEYIDRCDGDDDNDQ